MHNIMYKPRCRITFIQQGRIVQGGGWISQGWTSQGANE